MATENLEINIGANTQDLQSGLNQATQSINNFGRAVQSASKPTADATQSLVNLSRIAQDAPYGFIGISNNLNPMLESFQRLTKETGSSSEALKAMVSGITGPAGLGLALGVVSALLITFNKQLTEFGSNIFSTSTVSKEMKTSLEGIGTEFTNAAEKVNKVKFAFDEYHKGILTGAEALKIYNKELGSNLGIKNNINDAEATFNAKTAEYLQAQLQRALADSASKKAAEELLKLKLEELKKPEEYTSFFDISGAGVGGGPGVGVNTAEQARKAQLARQKEALKEQQDIVNQYMLITENAKIAADTIAKSSGINLTPDKVLKQKDYSLQEYIQGLEADIKATMRWADEEEKISERMIKAWKKLGDVALADTSSSKIRAQLDLQAKEREKESEKPFSEKKLDKDLPDWAKKWQEDKIKFDAGIKESGIEAEKFARTVSNDVATAFGVMFQAFEAGKSPLVAFQDLIDNLIKKLAEAAIKAAIFQSIMAAFGLGGTQDFATGFIGNFQKLLGFADGGVVSRPTIAMVGEGGQSEAIMPLNKLGNMMNSTFNAGAMSGGGAGNGQFVLKGQDLILAINRSNASLNLRRGY